MGDDITIGVTEIVNNIEVTAQPNDQIVDINVIDNTDEVTLNITPTVIEINVNKGSSYAKWGTILGTLSDQLDLKSALDAKVPYTGATGNVTLGEYGLTSGYLQLDTTPTSTPTTIGTMYWDAANRTAALIDGDGDTTLQIGQEQRILVHNNTGSTLTDGQVVYVTGSTGELPSVSLANASSETTSAATIGVVTESIANGANGFITTSGIVHGLNTLAFNEGDLLWLGTTAGTFSTTKPTSPAHLVLIGYVIKKAGGNGSILVKIQNTQELAESSDVLFTSLANNDILVYESSPSNLWKNKSISTILGYTPANDSNVVHLSGSEIITGSKLFSAITLFQNVVSFDSAGGILLKKNGLSTYNQIAALDGGFQFYPNSGTDFYFKIQPSNISFGLTNKNVTFNNSLLTSDRIFDLPNVAGTLALTSQIPSVSGTTNFLPKFTGASALGNSLIYDNGTNVGIGTTSPSGLLTINSTASNGVRFSLESSGTMNGIVSIGSNAISGLATTDMGLWARGAMAFETGANGEKMRITSGGNVGIGTTSPSYTLHVNGSVAGTSAYNNLSDKRYKKDILPIENALDKILALNGVTFNWDKEATDMNLDDNNHIGLLAQDVEEIIPQAVTTGTDENQTKSVAYTDLVPVLIEAIKELKAEIEILKNK